MSFDLESYRKRLSELTAQGIYIGSSSWKYPGSRGLVYDQQQYTTRSKFSEAKFDRLCLAEYAETYNSVCVDAGYYGALPQNTWPVWPGRCPRRSSSDSRSRTRSP